VTIDPRRAALLVMDYQNGIVAMLPDPETQLDRAERAIALMRGAGATIGYVRVAFTEPDLAAIPEHSRFASRAGQLSDDAPHTQIHVRVAPRDGDLIVRKTRVGAFSTTDLDAQLRSRGIDTIVLAGISTSGVVLSTVRDGADRDYRVLVLSDASADPDAEVHAFLTERIFPRQAEVLTTDELAASLG
jgi:nicotinamidase-related amidase